MSKNIVAVLGPTNTGKTHYAIERMLSYNNGIIGLPLRLLAREVYDRLVKLSDFKSVALVTGEERIVPENAKFWVCTTESMPGKKKFEFVAIDEIQLCADLERGHIFTDRFLKMRGQYETLFLGSSNFWSVIAKLVPEAKLKTRHRFSDLKFSGSKKISRMKSRSAVIGFSVENIYAIAELVKRQKGGAAVVLGALSPRTRNKQVELYQNGDVEFLIATDAIGMGLNLDIDHIAFSAIHKFDGKKMRELHNSEVAQIAGRAGRYLRAGTFGTTGDAALFSEETIEAVENHKFKSIKKIVWRNSDLKMDNTDYLIKSLETKADSPIFIKGREAVDLTSLKAITAVDTFFSSLRDPILIDLLWNVCQIPDFRSISLSDHIGILGKVFHFLKAGGTITNEWFGGQLKKIDRYDGDIDTISKRLAFVRTWTYVAQRNNWVDDPEYWRSESRRIEDGLSDALHEALTKRFVDRRTSILIRKLKQKETLVAEVSKDGEVRIDGQFIGKLQGFRFSQDKTVSSEEHKALRSTSIAALETEFYLRSTRLYNAPDTDISFTEKGVLVWGDHAIGKIVPGEDILRPKVQAFVDLEAGAEVREKVERRLRHYLDRKIETLFEPLLLMKKDPQITGLSKGVAFLLVESLGILPRADVSGELKDLDQESRGLLRKHGVRFGQYNVFVPILLKPAATRLRLVLWSIINNFAEFPAPPEPGLVTIGVMNTEVKGYFTKVGYHYSGDWALRIDMLERLADLLRKEDSKNGFEATPDMLSITGMSHEQFASLMSGLGYKVKKGERQKVKTSKVEKTNDESAVEMSNNLAGSDEELNEPFWSFSWQVKKRPQKIESKRELKTKSIKRKKSSHRNPVKDNSNKHLEKTSLPDPDNPFSVLMSLKEK
jgi:ATP-dependent RNA helicase SUPV3L1/SUV3